MGLRRRDDVPTSVAMRRVSRLTRHPANRSEAFAFDGDFTAAGSVELDPNDVPFASSPSDLPESWSGVLGAVLCTGSTRLAVGGDPPLAYATFDREYDGNEPLERRDRLGRGGRGSGPTGA